jgi:serpin B
VNIPMMRQRGMFAYTETPQFKMLEMPYKGDDVSMLVVLPTAADGLRDVEEALTPEVLDAAMDSLTKTDVVVRLPRYGTTSEFSLSDTLRSLGMSTAFTSAADFSGITDERLMISDVLHKAYLNVDEKGTEAAAATGIVFEVVSVPMASFSADHPFLFLIRDNTTESILFMGRVVSPTPPMAAVPEPASSLLAALALIGLTVAGRGHRRHCNPLVNIT